MLGLGRKVLLCVVRMSWLKYQFPGCLALTRPTPAPTHQLSLFRQPRGGKTYIHGPGSQGMLSMLINPFAWVFVVALFLRYIPFFGWEGGGRVVERAWLCGAGGLM